jgi:hypothetical protein
MGDQSDGVTVYVTYRGTAETRFEKSSTWSDQHRLARE